MWLCRETHLRPQINGCFSHGTYVLIAGTVPSKHASCCMPSLPIRAMHRVTAVQNDICNQPCCRNNAQNIDLFCAHARLGRHCLDEKPEVLLACFAGKRQKRTSAGFHSPTIRSKCDREPGPQLHDDHVGRSPGKTPNYNGEAPIGAMAFKTPATRAEWTALTSQ